MNASKLMLIAAVAAGLCLSAQAQNNNGGGQGGGQGGGRGQGNRPNFANMTPEEIRQRMADRYKEQLEITDDAEWKIIQPLVENVATVRMTLMAGNFRGMRGGGRGGPGGPGGGPGGPGAPGGPGGMFGTPSPEIEALNKAIEAKASNAELKQALAKVADARKVKEAELAKAQGELRKVLSVRQEALATANGLL